MAAAESSKPLRVLVIGAGSAGLLIAHALKQVNISCTVFEADLSSTIRPRDWSFGIYWAQSPLASIIPPELVSQVEHSQVDDKTPSADDVLPIYNIETGKLICDLPSPFSLRLQRRKWLKLISQGLDIQYGKRLSGVHSDGNIVTATFSDGTQETGNLLVGSEGAHSLTREFLLGPEKGKLIPCPVVGTVAITKLPREAALKIRETHTRHIIGFHPNGYFTWCGIHECVGLDNPEDWTFMLMNSWISNEDPGLPSKGFELVKDVRERAKVYGSPFREIFESVPDDAPIWHGRLSLWPTQEFDSRNGTVTLAGDAAHPMTYHRGQGLNNSILDAADFLEKLKAMQGSTAEDLKKAVNNYNAALWPRGNEAVLSSEQNTMMIHNWSQLLESPLIKLGLKRK